jgi:hypothetical protein
MKKIFILILMLSSMAVFSQSILISPNVNANTYKIRRNGVGFETKSNDLPIQMGTHLSLNNASIHTYNLDPLVLNSQGITLTIQNTGNVSFASGKIKFGNDAPGIRIEEYEGITSAIDGGGASIALPITYYNQNMTIISLKLVVDCGVNGNVSEEYTFNPGFQVSVSYDQINRVIYVWNKAGNCYDIKNKPFKIMMTYIAGN